MRSSKLINSRQGDDRTISLTDDLLGQQTGTIMVDLYGHMRAGVR